jgi:hypothetical protein
MDFRNMDPGPLQDLPETVEEHAARALQKQHVPLAGRD